MKDIKYGLLAIAIVLMLLLIIFAPNKNTTRIEDAVIDPETGAIAFTYFYSRTANIVLTVCDSTGEVLFSKGIDSAGGSASAISFIDGNVCIYVSRTNTLLTYTKGGELIEKQEDVQLNVPSPWRDWDSARGQRSFTWNGNIYVYEQTPFPQYVVKEECCLYVRLPSGEEKTLYYDSNP